MLQTITTSILSQPWRLAVQVTPQPLLAPVPPVLALPAPSPETSRARFLADLRSMLSRIPDRIELSTGTLNFRLTLSSWRKYSRGYLIFELTNSATAVRVSTFDGTWQRVYLFTPGSPVKLRDLIRPLVTEHNATRPAVTLVSEVWPSSKTTHILKLYIDKPAAFNPDYQGIGSSWASALRDLCCQAGIRHLHQLAPAGWRYEKARPVMPRANASSKKKRKSHATQTQIPDGSRKAAGLSRAQT